MGYDDAWGIEVLSDGRYEMPPDHLVHDAYVRNEPYDASRPKHAGVLVTRLQRK